MNRPNEFDNINKPSHYQGKYGLEAIDVVRELCRRLVCSRGLLLGQRNEVHVEIPTQKRIGRFERKLEKIWSG